MIDDWMPALLKYKIARFYFGKIHNSLIVDMP